MKEQIIHLRDEYIQLYKALKGLKRTFDDDLEAIHRLQGKLSAVQLFVMELDLIINEFSSNYTLSSESKQVTLKDMPPGLFMYNGTLGFKSKYRNDDGFRSEAFCVSTGEYFYPSDINIYERENLLVTPL